LSAVGATGASSPCHTVALIIPIVLLLVVAFIAGVLTILAPCTLPVVPLVLGASATGGRRRASGVVAGFAATFLGAVFVLAAVLGQIGLTVQGLRLLSAILVGLVGLTLVVPRVAGWLERRLVPVAGLGTSLAARRPGDGLLGGLVLGGAIGLIWAPCVGPIMAGVIAAAAVHGPTLETLGIAVAYIAGAAVPIGLIARWGRVASELARGSTARAWLSRAVGGAMLATALLIVTGLDLTVENAVVGALPAGWTGVLFAVEQQPAIQEKFHMLRTDGAGAGSQEGSSTPSSTQRLNLPAPVASSLPASVALEDQGRAPELLGITAWINTEPLAIASLKGKVVLVEFWTFGCINCIHVQPYVKAWYDRYEAAGLVVIGVHTPELAFERELPNVRDAVTKADLRYPVAFDPDFATWSAFRNSYWPAFFFIDRGGRIRHTHIGEGDYDGSEQVIRELLLEPA